MAQDDRFTGIEQAVALPALLGYLNFSEGKPDPRFQRQLDDAFVFLAQHRFGRSPAIWAKCCKCDCKSCKKPAAPRSPTLRKPRQ